MLFRKGFSLRTFLNRRGRGASFLALILTGAIVACSNLGQTSGVNVGPNFPSKTLYASNSNQNAISIYTNGTQSGKGPTYNIGGSNTGLDGPQYLAFDKAQNLWVTNYNPNTQRALLIEFEALATGNVVPLNTIPLVGRPRGIFLKDGDRVRIAIEGLGELRNPVVAASARGAGSET